MEISWNSNVDLFGMNQKPPREFWPPLEASLGHFLITPPSHFRPQKVEGFVVELIGAGRESMAVILDRAEILSREILSSLAEGVKKSHFHPHPVPPPSRGREFLLVFQYICALHASA